MSKTRILLGLIFILCALSAFAQTSAEEAKKKIEAEIRLLDQLVEDTRNLRLPENRAFIYARIGSVYWQFDEKQARKLFQDAIGEVLNAQTEAENEKVKGKIVHNLLYGQMPRMQVIEYIAARDPEFALEALLKTRPARIALDPLSLPDENLTTTQNYARNELQTEQRLLARAAERNPQLAAERVRDALKKGLTYETLNLLKQVHLKDEKLGNQLSEEVARKLLEGKFAKGYQTMEMMGFFLNDWGRERQAEEKSPQISDALMRGLVSQMTDYWLDPKNNQPYGYYQVKPLVEKFFPDRAEKIRLKAEKINAQSQSSAYNEYNQLVQSSLPPNELLEKIEKVPASSRNDFYRIVADRYAQNGNVSQAEKIISENIDDEFSFTYLSQFYANLSNRLMSEGKLQEARTYIDRIPEQTQRVGLLVQLAQIVFQKDKENRRQAIEILSEARALLPDAPETQIELSSLLNLAGAFARIEPQEAFRILEGIVPTLNELIQAAYVMAKFRNPGVVRQGEMYVTSNYLIGSYNFHSILGTLKSSDHERAIRFADGFQRMETRIFIKLQMIDEKVFSDNLVDVYQFSRRRDLLY